LNRLLKNAKSFCRFVSGQFFSDFPILSAGPTPHVPLDNWEFTIRTTLRFCSGTRWSKLGTLWEGVSLDPLFAHVKTHAEYALVHSYRDSRRISCWEIC
jgi:hypothetical protein